MNPKNYSLKKTRVAAKRIKFALVVSKFNHHVTQKLLDGAISCLKNHGISKKCWDVFYCPGAFELPQVANNLAAQKKWDAIICLGAVIRGETPHFEYVASAAAYGIQKTALEHSIPVIFGVLTTNDEKQAIERAGGLQGNKGWDAVITALEMHQLFKNVKNKKKK